MSEIKIGDYVRCCHAHSNRLFKVIAKEGDLCWIRDTLINDNSLENTEDLTKVEPTYRLLNNGEIIKNGDELLFNGRWIHAAGYDCRDAIVRRKIKSYEDL